MEGLRDAFARVLDEALPPARVRAVARGEAWDEARAAIEATGFLDALASEVPLSEVAGLLMELGRHAAPAELAETMLGRGGVGSELAAAFARAALIAGAAERVLEMTVDHARQRNQFGKPIAAQQALQQMLAVMAEDVLALRLSVELAAARGLPLDEARVASAKAMASEAASRIADSAHAIHGAIGISAEHDLQLFTSAMRRWRLEAGAESAWQERLGAALLDSGDDPLDWARGALF